MKYEVSGKCCILINISRFKNLFLDNTQLKCEIEIFLSVFETRGTDHTHHYSAVNVSLMKIYRDKHMITNKVMQ